MAGVFINYRTGDGEAMAALLHEKLRPVFGPKRVFLDSTGLPPGEEFPPELKRRLKLSTALVVLMGPNWLELKDAAGGRRIDRHDDYVRYEIRKSLKRDKFVLPVLLDGRDSLPSPDELPADIARLVKFQYRHLRAREVDSDLADIVAFLRDKIPPLEPGPPLADVRRKTISAKGGHHSAVAAGDGASATVNPKGQR